MKVLVSIKKKKKSTRKQRLSNIPLPGNPSATSRQRETTPVGETHISKLVTMRRSCVEISHKPSTSANSFILTSDSFVLLAGFKYTERVLPYTHTKWEFPHKHTFLLLYLHNPNISLHPSFHEWLCIIQWSRLHCCFSLSD